MEAGLGLRGGPSLVGAPGGAGAAGLARALGGGGVARGSWARAAGLTLGLGAAAAVGLGLAAFAIPRPLVRLAARKFWRKCVFELPPREGGERKCAPPPLPVPAGPLPFRLFCFRGDIGPPPRPS